MDKFLKGKGLRSAFREDFGGGIEGEQNRGKIRIINAPGRPWSLGLMADLSPGAKQRDIGPPDSV